MKQLFWIFLALLSVSAAKAAPDGTYNYGYWAPKHISSYLKEVDAEFPKEGPRQCENVYANALNRGVLDIRYALGYFDDSQGVDVIVNGVNYGLSPSLDIEIFQALRKELTKNCWSFSKRLCGFKEYGDANSGKVILTKQEKIHGRNITIRLTLTHASASPSFMQNKGALASRQSRLTQQSEENFFGGLRVADVVIYNGHSRNGGGPDFNPPILNSHNKVNYKGYYEKKRPGILRTIASLKDNPNKGFILGLFSCYSRKHFYQTFMDANPQQGLILSADTIDYFDALKGSIGYLEGILRGSCGGELSESARQGDKIRNGFTDYNIN